MKRFQLEATEKMQSFLEEDATMEFVAITAVEGAKLKVEYGGAHATRPTEEMDVDSFVGVKSHRAKGKRITTYDVASLSFFEPEPSEEPKSATTEDEVLDVDLATAEQAVEGLEGEQAYEQSVVEDDEPVLMIDSAQLNLF